MRITRVGRDSHQSRFLFCSQMRLRCPHFFAARQPKTRLRLILDKFNVRLSQYFFKMRRERPTAAYRLYFFDPENHIENVEILECACDQEALATAARLMNGRDLELWDRDRFISRLPKT